MTYVLPSALKNTVLLLAGVAIMVGVIGVGSAWAVTAWDFPGRKILSWALLLPLAMPTYIVAFAWLDLLHPIGPLQTFIRFILGFDSPRQFRLPDLRSLSENPGYWTNSKYFIQTADIDATETNTWNVGDHDGNAETATVPMGFSCIGNSTAGSFNGKYDEFSNQSHFK